MRGSLDAIWIKRGRGGPMDPRREAVLVAGRGLEGNANQGGRRQVTVISADSWAEVQRDLGVAVDPSTRRANLMVRGIDLERSRGSLLRVGDCVIRLLGETRPCNLMDELQPGLRATLDPHWRGGAFGEVLHGGTIRVGDGVTLEEEDIEATRNPERAE